MTTQVIQISSAKVQPNGKTFPLVRTPKDPKITRAKMLEWVATEKEVLREEMMTYGALLLRGFPVQSPEDFEAILDAAEFVNMPYVGGAAPRAQVTASRILTANESPPDEPIPFHHEMAQVPNPPNYIFFCCDTPSQTGGETAIVHSNTVYELFRAINPAYSETVENVGVQYRRVMPDQDDCTSPIGRSWRSTFQTDDRGEAEARMREVGMTWSWRNDGCLETLTAPLKAIRTDERTGLKTFFNSIIAAYTGWTDRRNDPKNAVRLANGQPMDEAILKHTAKAMNEAAVAFKWEKGDVLMIDNRLVLHSRRPFSGQRRILASIAVA